MVVLGQYNSVLLSIKLYWVSKVLVCLMPVYIGKSGDLVRCYRSLTDGQTHRQQNMGLLSLYKVKRLRAPKLEILEREMNC